MRRLVLAAGSAVLLTGCGSAAETAKNPQPPDDSPPLRVHAGAVGAIETLTGPGRLRLAVKVRQVIGNAVGKGGFDTPRKGERFVAVGLVMKNLGDTPYLDSPEYGAQVVDDTGQGYDPTIASVTAGAGFARTVRLRRGQARAGFIVFAVPKTATLTMVRYTLAHDRGEWRIA